MSFSYCNRADTYYNESMMIDNKVVSEKMMQEMNCASGVNTVLEVQNALMAERLFWKKFGTDTRLGLV